MTSANSEIKIRPADALDASNIVRLLKQLWLEETALPADRVNDRKAMRYVMETLEHPGRVLVAELSGRIVGVTAALVTQEPWSEESLIEVRWLYAITKSKDEILQVLLEQAEAFANEQELPMLARVFRYAGDRVDHFGGRKGYVPMGPSYLRIPVEALLSKPVLGVDSRGLEITPQL
jgi:N-acetylglutamate synthase-like GNAT family acetyltransferase